MKMLPLGRQVNNFQFLTFPPSLFTFSFSFHSFISVFLLLQPSCQSVCYCSFMSIPTRSSLHLAHIELWDDFSEKKVFLSKYLLLWGNTGKGKGHIQEPVEDVSIHISSEKISILKTLYSNRDHKDYEFPRFSVPYNFFLIQFECENIQKKVSFSRFLSTGLALSDQTYIKDK